MSFAVGDEIRLVDYAPYGDYISHRGQIATIIDFSRAGFDWHLQWSDGSTSCANERNMIKVSREWDSEENIRTEEKCLSK